MSHQEIKTPALVLSTLPYEDRKLIAHLYTRALGRIAFVVSGPKRRRYFQRGSLLYVRFYYKPQWEVQRLLEADWMMLYENLHHEFAHMPYLLLMLEVLNQVLVAPDEILFDFVAEGFLTLDKAREPETALKAFLSQLIGRIGGESPPLPLDWPDIEAQFAALIPNWRPLQTLSMIRNLSLPVYDRKH